LRSQLDVSCYWSNISGLCKQIWLTSTFYFSCLTPNSTAPLELSITTTIAAIQIIITAHNPLYRPSLIMIVPRIACIIARIQHNSWSGRDTTLVQVLLNLSWLHNWSWRLHWVVCSWFQAAIGRRGSSF
jgi:hypothetical protein